MPDTPALVLPDDATVTHEVTVFPDVPGRFMPGEPVPVELTGGTEEQAEQVAGDKTHPLELTTGAVEEGALARTAGMPSSSTVDSALNLGDADVPEITESAEPADGTPEHKAALEAAASGGDLASLTHKQLDALAAEHPEYEGYPVDASKGEKAAFLAKNGLGPAELISGEA